MIVGGTPKKTSASPRLLAVAEDSFIVQQPRSDVRDPVFLSRSIPELLAVLGAFMMTHGMIMNFSRHWVYPLIKRFIWNNWSLVIGIMLILLSYFQLST